MPAPPARPAVLRLTVAAVLVAWLLALPGAADAEIRISNLSVFLNDSDITLPVP